MIRTVTVSILRMLVSGSVDQFIRFVIQHGIQSFFYAVSDKIFEIVLYQILIELYNVIRHSSVPPLVDLVW